MTKEFWMSFCDSSRPKGTQFLGVAIVPVTQEEADEAIIDVWLRFPCAQNGAEWIAAAMTKAHATGCNPGGEIASHEIPDWCDDKALMAAPRLKLMQKDELIALGVIAANQLTSIHIDEDA